MRLGLLALLTATLAGQPVIAAQSDGPIVVDGFFTDWSATASAIADPAGDAEGPTDILALAGERRGEQQAAAGHRVDAERRHTAEPVEQPASRERAEPHDHLGGAEREPE